MTTAAVQIAEKNVRAARSKRIAMRRQSLNLPNMIWMGLQVLYRLLLKSI